ncbi:MAG: hypothetical protein KAQ68_11590, partial [Clostridiales bacterium]|nr:hypothetical protein [Clostridiales bacterium]
MPKENKIPRIYLKNRTITFYLSLCFLLVNICIGEQTFLGTEDILEGWNSTYGSIENMEVKYCEKLVTDLSSLDGRFSALTRYQHVERIEEGDKYHIRYSIAEDGFENPDELMEHAFNGKATKEYFGRDKSGTIAAGLGMRDVQTMNSLRLYMLMSVSPVMSGKKTQADTRTRFEQLLESPYAKVSESLDKIAGQSCHVVEIERAGEITMKIWIAHHKGMFPMKYQSFRNGEISIEIEVEEFASVLGKGTEIWYPTKASRTFHKNKSRANTRRYELSIYKFAPNLELDDESFTFDFPDGTPVADSVVGLSYV